MPYVPAVLRTKNDTRQDFDDIVTKNEENIEAPQRLITKRIQALKGYQKFANVYIIVEGIRHTKKRIFKDDSSPLKTTNVETTENILSIGPQTTQPGAEQSFIPQDKAFHILQNSSITRALVNKKMRKNKSYYELRMQEMQKNALREHIKQQQSNVQRRT